MMEPLLKVDRLTVGYQTPSGISEALRDVSLEIAPGQVYGVVGESGSGKSTLALAIMRYLPASGHVRKGTISFRGQDLNQINLEDMRRIWGAELGLVPQDPLSALNPSIRVGEQVAEVLRKHRGLNAKEAEAISLAWLEQVRLSEPWDIARSYPHQLSGGMQQRVMIAMALCTEPALLVLDEPTTNLDATTQAGILDLLCELIAARETAAMYISHNLGVVAQICDELLVLYAGEVIEHGPTRELFRHPLHPYTHALLGSIPRPGMRQRERQMEAIQGRIPSLESLPSGCIFRARCPLAIDICETKPPLAATGQGRKSGCHRWEEIARREVDASQHSSKPLRLKDNNTDPTTTLKVEALRVHYHRYPGLLRRLGRRETGVIRAVEDLSFEINSGETLGLVGESGSGKTTVGRAILGLVVPSGGEIQIQGTLAAPRLGDRSLELRRKAQMVFQNPSESFNPYLTVAEALSRPLVRLRGISRAQVPDEVNRLLKSVQLPVEYADRLPGTLSGGEVQRVALARAFASSPSLLIADEAVSALDVSIQAGILNLLFELQAASGSATLFISHDLAVVGYVADRVAVIYLGQLMQLSTSDALFNPPHHPYTEALLSAIPRLDPGAKQEPIPLSELPASRWGGGGCPFEARCPRKLGEVCSQVTPPWQSTAAGSLIYCHIPADELMQQQENMFQFSAESGGEG